MTAKLLQNPKCNTTNIALSRLLLQKYFLSRIINNETIEKEKARKWSSSIFLNKLIAQKTNKQTKNSAKQLAENLPKTEIKAITGYRFILPYVKEAFKILRFLK